MAGYLETLRAPFTTVPSRGTLCPPHMTVSTREDTFCTLANGPTGRTLRAPCMTDLAGGTLRAPSWPTYLEKTRCSYGWLPGNNKVHDKKSVEVLRYRNNVFPLQGLPTWRVKRKLDFPKFSFRENKKSIFFAASYPQQDCNTWSSMLMFTLERNHLAKLNSRRLTSDMQQAKSLHGTWREI